MTSSSTSSGVAVTGTNSASKSRTGANTFASFFARQRERKRSGLPPPIRGRERRDRRRSRGRVTSAPRTALARAQHTAYNTPYAHAVEAPMSVPHALLALLSEGPKYGLRLQNEFQSRTGEVWPLNVGQVYTTLQRLERDGLVEAGDGDGERSQKRYRITAAGDRELAEWLRTPPDLVPPPRDELVIKMLVALQVPETDVHLRSEEHTSELQS